MNNDEKRIPAEDVESKNVGSTENAANGGNWWKNLTVGLKAAIIAGAAVVVAAVVVLVVLLAGGKDNADGGAAGNGSSDSGNNPSTDAKTETYSVTVVTAGGMAMAELPVYIYEYEDGFLGDLVDGGYGATDVNGKAVFNLPANGSYAVKIDNSIPDGYDAKAHYPLVAKDLTLTVSSAVIAETDLAGIKYGLGDIIRDFSVTTTELSGNKFTLSEVLKDKKAVLINFWYTDCSWCVTEFPLMQEAYEKYKDDLAIIALDPITDDDIVDIRSFKNSMGLTFDVAQDLQGIAAAFGVTGYPTSVVIDRYGAICMIEEGAITSQRAFDVIFEHFTADDYKQKLVVNYEDIVPKEKPNISMPSGEEISDAFDSGTIDGITYLPYPDDAKDSEKEYSWPFVISQYNGETVITPSNAFKEGSFAQLVINVPLRAGEALAFDYLASTELGADYLYVIVDGKDIYSISGEGEEYKSCFAYVAEEDATYQLALVYQKDSSDDVGDDTVYLKNLRIVSIDEIDEPTYIFRFAATNPDAYSEYQDYIVPVLGADGYYHVGTADGPLLLANLMGYTRFSEDNYVYNMCLEKDYEAKLTRYCNYASNSQINGVCPVTEELKELLLKIVADYGDATNPNDWLKICNYYDSYGTDEELSDPIKGLATFSAYDVILSTTPMELDENGQPLLNTNNFPNTLTYDRVIMPRGLYAKFTPTESGTYYITARAPGLQEGTFIECEAWLCTTEGLDSKNPWYTYANVDRNNVGEDKDMSNVYMIAYLEAGVDYYIDIAYGDVYQEGTISFRVERLGGEGVYRFALASPGFFTALQDDQGGLTETVSGGIALELGADGIWREKRTDDREGSIVYADFTRPTGIFSQSITELIAKNAFNLATNENDEYALALLKSNQAYNFYLDLYLKDLWGSDYTAKYDEYKVSEVLDGVYHGEVGENGSAEKSENDLFILDLRDSMATNDQYNNAENIDKFLRSYWGDTYQENMDIYKIDEVLAGNYHGSGEDYTEEISKYLDKVIVAGYNELLGETILEGDERIGCVVVDAELAELLQILMDKYTFEGVEYSWAKLCYYHQYFCSATPF